MRKTSIIRKRQQVGVELRRTAEVREREKIDSSRKLMRPRKKGLRKIRIWVDFDRLRKKITAEQLWAIGQLRKLWQEARKRPCMAAGARKWH